MEQKDEKNLSGQPSDSAAAHNVPDPQDDKRPAEPLPYRVPEIPASQIRYSSTGSRKILRRGMQQPGCWAQGGTLECFTSTAWALTDLAELREVETNPNTNEVEKVLAARIGKENRIWIHPTHATDTNGTEIFRDNKGKLRIPLYNFLAREKLLIAVRRRERFEFEVVTDARSPVGPALLLDFSKVLETKVIQPKKKKGEQGDKGDKSKKSPDKKAPELKKPEPETEPSDEEE